MSDTKFVIEEVEEIKGDCFSNKTTADPNVKEEPKECFSRLNLSNEPSVEETVQSRNFIANFMQYIKSKSFFRSCDDIAKKKGVTQKQVATNFFQHVLGTISDVFHIVIDTVQDVVVTTLDILSKVLGAGASLICNVAKRLVRVVTLNKTCVA